jgi:hypothetical protein
MCEGSDSGSSGGASSSGDSSTGNGKTDRSIRQFKNAKVRQAPRRARSWANSGPL